MYNIRSTPRKIYTGPNWQHAVNSTDFAYYPKAQEKDPAGIVIPTGPLVCGWPRHADGRLHW